MKVHLMHSQWVEICMSCCWASWTTGGICVTIPLVPTVVQATWWDSHTTIGLTWWEHVKCLLTCWVSAFVFRGRSFTCLACIFSFGTFKDLIVFINFIPVCPDSDYQYILPDVQDSPYCFYFTERFSLCYQVSINASYKNLTFLRKNSLGILKVLIFMYSNRSNRFIVSMSRWESLWAFPQESSVTSALIMPGTWSLWVGHFPFPSGRKHSWKWAGSPEAKEPWFPWRPCSFSSLLAALLPGEEESPFLGIHLEKSVLFWRERN